MLTGWTMEPPPAVGCWSWTNIEVLWSGGCGVMVSFSIPDCRLPLAAIAAAVEEARWMAAVVFRGVEGTGMAGEATDAGGVGGSNGDAPKLCWLAAASIDALCEAATDAADERREDAAMSTFGCCS